MKQYDVITCGSATMDVFIKTEAEPLIERMKNGEKDICYPLGQKLLIKDLDFQTGGGGTNTAVAFARLGLRTAFLGTIGDDDQGKTVLAQLKSEHIEFVGQQTGKTGFSVVLDAKHDDRTILTYKGANDLFSFTSLPHTRCFYASSMTKNFASLEKALVAAKQNGAKTAFNPSNYLAQKGKAYLKKILKATDVLICNKEEAILLHGSRVDVRQLLNELRKTGPSICCITDGKQGAYVSDGKQAFHVLASPVSVCETTGAGDAFGASFVAGLLLHLSLENCARLAMINAESVISNYGAKNILLGKDEAFRRLRADRRHITIL